MMGSGGMIIMSQKSCMVDVARYFLEFLNDESCGKCTSCRDGSREMHRILERICNGQGREGDIELLDELGTAVREASLCGLGQSLPNPVLSSLEHFREEYEDHINNGRCPAGVCKAPLPRVARRLWSLSHTSGAPEARFETVAPIVSLLTNIVLNRHDTCMAGDRIGLDRCG